MLTRDVYRTPGPYHQPYVLENSNGEKRSNHLDNNNGGSIASSR